ncbi:phage tail tape measure protein [Bacillus sonorensis]|uniref:Tape measure protein n=1 Tax=Bacillus sonorensis TaxID=119858 RepID=A0ABM6LER3_9BACI|nr:phage tail tape measure protein [Bacillus sonorensis]ASB87744.1 Tape measure protein [Bacillus sonorensis]
MADHTINVRIGATITDLTRSLSEAQSRISSFGQEMAGFSRSIALGFGAAATGMAAGLSATVTKSAEFDTAMRKAGAIAGATGSDFQKMRDSALELGASTTQTSSQVAEAMTELAAKGFDANQVIAAMPGIIAAAEASGEDLALTSDTITSALNAFNMKASESGRVADVLAMTANKSAAGMTSLQYAFKYAAGPAAQLGISLEELAAATGIMVDAGLAGEQAGTTLRSALLRLVDPPKRAANTLEDLGVTTVDQNGNFRSLKDIIGQLQKGMAGMTDAQKSAALASIFGTEAVTGMMAVVSKGPDALGEFTKELENSGGAAAKAAKQMKEGIGGSLEHLSGAFESFAITIGDQLAPYVSAAADKIADLTERFNKLSDGTKKFIAVTAAIVTGLVAFIAISAATVTAVASFSSSLGTLAFALNTTRKALLLTMFQFTLGIGAVIALAAAFAYVYENSDTVREKLQDLGNKLGQKVTPVVKNLTALFKGLAETLTGDFTKGSIALHNLLPPSVANVVVKGVAIIRGAFEDLKKAISDAFNGDFSGFAEFIPNIIGIIVGGIPGLIVAGSKYLPAIAQGIQQNMPTILNTAVNIVNSFVNMIVTNLPIILQAGIQIIQGLLNGFTQALPSILTAATQIINSLVQAIVTLLPALIGAGILILTSLIQGIVEALPQIIQAATTMLTTLINTIVTLMPMIIQAGIQILNALISGIIQVLPQLIEAALQLILALANAIIENLPTIIDAGIQILNSLIDGIIQILPQLIEMAIYLVVTIAQALIENLPKIIDAGIQLLLALIDGILQNLPQLIEAAIELIFAIAQALIDHLPEILDAGMQILMAVVDGIMQLLPELFSVGMEIVGEIAGSIIDNSGEIFNAGADLMHGLWDGIWSMKDWIGQKIGDFMGGITKDIKDTFGIHSPSRVFRDEIGKFLPMGLAVGIERNIGVVKAAANEMANAALFDAQDYSYTVDAAYNRSVPLSFSRDDYASGNNSVSPINITLNYSGSGSREDAEKMYDLIQSKFNEDFRIQQRISGVKGG